MKQGDDDDSTDMEDITGVESQVMHEVLGAMEQYRGGRRQSGSTGKPAARAHRRSRQPWHRPSGIPRAGTLPHGGRAPASRLRPAEMVTSPSWPTWTAGWS